MNRNEQQIRRFVTEVLNQGNFDILEELIHPQYTYRSPEIELQGAVGLQELLQDYRAAFPDLHVAVDSLISAGDHVTLAFTLTGTHLAELMGVPATGKRIKVHGVVLSRFEDNRMIDEWELLDQWSMFQQLGLINQAA